MKWGIIMIPKIIHYCWFGKNTLPELAKRCIDSWKRYCPDYEIIEWNEDNFDITKNEYVKEAYESRKWAFVTDYVRLYALYNYGGIYMDTDVEVIKSIDIFLQEQSFSGFEAKDRIPTGIMACEKRFDLFGELLNDYNDRKFINSDGTLNLTTNVTYITEACLNSGLVLNGEKQTIRGFTLYPADVFCPKDANTHQLNITSNTHTIHHFDGSWISKKDKKKQKLIKFLGPQLTSFIVKVKHKIRGV